MAVLYALIKGLPGFIWEERRRVYQLLSWGAHCRQPLPPYSSVEGELPLRVRSPPQAYPRNFPPVLEAVLRAAAVGTPPRCSSNLAAVIPQEYFQTGRQPPSFQLVSLSVSALCFPLLSLGIFTETAKCVGGRGGCCWCSAINTSFSVQVPYLKEKLW